MVRLIGGGVLIALLLGFVVSDLSSCLRRESPDQEQSSGIRREDDSAIPPIPPSKVRAVPTDNGIEVHWFGTGSDIITLYLIYRRNSDDQEWSSVGKVTATERNRDEYSFLDTGIDIDSLYVYVVTAVDHYGNESDLSIPTEPVSKLEQTNS